MKKVLVVDDRATNRQILSQLARSLNKDVEVRTFDDPQPALEWTSEYVPDLVVTDYKMKSMTGADFIRRLRLQPSCKDVPVIVVTAYEDIAFRYRSLEEGATDFLLSPIDHREFRTRAQNLLILRESQKVQLSAQALEISNALAQQQRLLASLRESDARLRRMLDVALDAKDIRIVANLLKQPTDAMSLLVEALRRDARGPDERAKILQDMDSCTGQLEQRVRAFLDLVWTQQVVGNPPLEGQAPIVESEFRIMSLLRKLELESEPIVRRTQARLRVVGFNVVTRSDRCIVETILRNLLTNALISGQGGKVVMGCRLKGQQLQVFVSDQSPEIPDQGISRVLESLECALTDRCDSFGAGKLGLFIARRLAARLGQGLHFQSRRHHGSVVSLNLPVAPSSVGSARIASCRGE